MSEQQPTGQTAPETVEGAVPVSVLKERMAKWRAAAEDWADSTYRWAIGIRSTFDTCADELEGICDAAEPVPVAASGAGAETEQKRCYTSWCVRPARPGWVFCHGPCMTLTTAIAEAVAAATARADRAEEALTEARSAALKEAAEMVRDYFARNSYKTMGSVEAHYLALEIGRMAGGAEDTSTEKEGAGGE